MNAERSGAVGADSRERLVVRRGADGRFDIEVLVASVPLDALGPCVRDWLRARCHGEWLYVGFDTQNDESPEDLFIELWRDAASQSHLREALSRACADLLVEAFGTNEPWVEPLLTLIASTRPPACWKPLAERLPTLLPGPEQPYDHLWLLAASVYEEAAQRAEWWVPALSRREQRVFAFQALSHDLDKGVRALPTYLGEATERDIRILLPGALATLRAHGDAALERALRREQSDFEAAPRLKQAIEDELQRRGMGCAFVGRAQRQSPQPCAQRESAEPRGNRWLANICGRS